MSLNIVYFLKDVKQKVKVKVIWVDYKIIEKICIEIDLLYDKNRN